MFESQTQLIKHFNTLEKWHSLFESLNQDRENAIFIYEKNQGFIYSNITKELSPVPWEKLLEKIKGEVTLMMVLKEQYRRSYLGICKGGDCNSKTSKDSVLEKRFTISYEKLDFEDQVFYVIKLKDTSALLSYEQDLLDLNYQLNEKSQQYKRSQLRLVRQDRLVSIGHLASGVAHEINNPLSFVKSNFEVMGDYIANVVYAYNMLQSQIEMLEQLNFQIQSPEIMTIISNFKEITQKGQFEDIENDYQILIEDTRDGIARVESIVNSLKSFSKLDYHSVLENYDLNEGIAFAVAILNNRLGDHIKLIKDMQFVPLTLAYGAEINQVILNVLMNAIDAIEETDKTEGLIKITSRSDKKFIYFEVLDNGKGILDNHKELIFDPFYTTKNTGKNSGLGLSIAYDVIVNKHNGEIGIDSKDGSGTTLLIKLPIKHVDISTVNEFMNNY